MEFEYSLVEKERKISITLLRIHTSIALCGIFTLLIRIQGLVTGLFYDNLVKF
jgi:hypothetical protein